MAISQRKIVYLKPAELAVSTQPAIIKTLLGSCVAITMFSRRKKIGAICHALLPQKVAQCIRCNDFLQSNSDRAADESFKYVNFSICYMLRKFENFGVNKREIEVKLFGGSDMFDLVNSERKVKTIGKQNIQRALEVIEAEGLCLLEKDIGGVYGRKILFETDTGVVYTKKIEKRLLPNNRR